MIQTYAWSQSRIKLFRDCGRKYYYNYILSWGGWDKNATKEQKEAYLLKNMTNQYMWVGSIVHEVVEKIVKSYKINKKWISMQDAKDMGITLLRSGWISSTKKEWKDDPKSVNLFEHFYEQPMDENKIRACKTKVLTCIENFYNSKLIEIVSQLKEEDWISLEDFQNFKMDDGSEVSLKIDLGFKYQQKIFLIDYKTGKINDSVIEQLITYAMYCLKKKFTSKVSEILIVPVYLMMENRDLIKLEVSKQQILNQATIIRNESKILKNIHEKKNDLSVFEMTDDLKKCNYCQFKKVCPGSVR